MFGEGYNNNNLVGHKHAELQITTDAFYGLALVFFANPLTESTSNCYITAIRSRSRTKLYYLSTRAFIDP
jgi:hypothetical protein